MIRIVKPSLLTVVLIAGIPGCAGADPPESGAPLEVVQRVDLERYTGRWYEIARLPNRFQNDCLSDVTAEYSLRDDGRIGVINRCTDENGKQKSADGVARVVDTESNAKLKVRFAPAFLSFLSAVWGDYWIIDLAPDYGYAVVGEPRRRYLWILSRSPQIEKSVFDGILRRVEAKGFATDELILTKHDEATYAERMAAEHAGDRPVPTEAAKVAAAAVVDQREVVYATVAGREVTGFLARPQGAATGGPALIVIQEWWGLNDNIRSMARRLAGEGYTALAVDLYRGQVAADPQRARELVVQAMERPAELEDNLRQAFAYLKQTLGASRVGTIGWCFGGGWSLSTALLLPTQIDACVIYYGRLVQDEDRLRTLDMPLLGIFGEDDGGIPVEGVREFEQTLQSLGKEAQIEIYPGAEHAFANPSGTRYNAAAAEDAWAKTLAFLDRTLRN